MYFKSEDQENERLANSISRSKAKVFEYALCNDFDYFVTLTLDANKYDRYNLSQYIKDLGRFIRYQRQKYDVEFEYILIPEPHKNGAWHMHALFKGLDPGQLKLFTLKDKIPQKIKQLIKEGRDIYNWTSYADKFGWNTLEKVKSREAISKYITKYISKSLEVDLKRDKGKKLYYVTRGLKTAVKVREGTLTSHELVGIPFNYENDYVKITDLNALQYLKIKHQLDQLDYSTLGGDLIPLTTT